MTTSGKNGESTSVLDTLAGELLDKETLHRTELEAIFGDQAVRSLAAAARRNLMERVGTLLDEERARYERVLADVGVSPEVAAHLRSAAAEVEAQR